MSRQYSGHPKHLQLVHRPPAPRTMSPRQDGQSKSETVSNQQSQSHSSSWSL